ncbi:cation transporter [Hydrogenophaga sp. 5NK40-0174]|uniref:cation transporter n=1 Tax=Hydrogenophaga sp. 5NK40-0174 TaxID=3127649 RepID=UPI003103DB01
MSNITLNVEGITCGHCEKAVQTAIKVLDPQAEVVIDRAQNKVEVTSSQSREAIAAAIEEEGYTVAA